MNSPTVTLPRMNNKYLESAQQRVPNRELLINIVSRRVRQLVQGHRPLTQTDTHMEPADIALKEIAEGKIGFEMAPLEDSQEAEQPSL